MTADAAASLDVHAQLSLQIDEVRVALTADGSRITLRTDDVGSLLTQATHAFENAPGPRPSMRQLAGATARVLDTNGLSARLVGNHGTVVEIGRDCSMRGSRLLFADSHVLMGRPSTLAATGLDAVRASTTTSRFRWYAAVGLLAVVLADRVRRMRSGWR